MVRARTHRKNQILSRSLVSFFESVVLSRKKIAYAFCETFETNTKWINEDPLKITSRLFWLTNHVFPFKKKWLRYQVLIEWFWDHYLLVIYCIIFSAQRRGKTFNVSQLIRQISRDKKRSRITEAQRQIYLAILNSARKPNAARKHVRSHPVGHSRAVWSRQKETDTWGPQLLATFLGVLFPCSLTLLLRNL